MEPYKPIDCSLHDHYEAAAVRRQRVSLTARYPDSLGERTGIITDIVASDGAEYLVLDNGPRIRLDHIESFAVSQS